MTHDASLPPNAPMTNGTLPPSAHDSHGEADASSLSNAPPSKTQPPPSLQGVCADIHSRVEAFLATPATDAALRTTQQQTRIAIGIVEKALKDYEFNELSLSYNGGKDCLVLLLLYLSVLHTHFASRRPFRPKEELETDGANNSEQEKIEDFPLTIPSIYAKPPDPFPLVTSFVDSSSARYHLNLVHISTNPGQGPKNRSHSSNPPASTPFPPDAAAPNAQSENKVVSFRDAFALYLSHYHPACRAIFVGTRRTDPHGSTLSPFQLTDGLWPRFMRIHPVLDFTLAQVWTFLRHPCIRAGEGCGTDIGDGSVGSGKGAKAKELIDYCEMYDQGYTSLGGVGDTLRNPKLKDPSHDWGYKPAFTMTEDEEERLGRE